MIARSQPVRKSLSSRRQKNRIHSLAALWISMGGFPAAEAFSTFAKGKAGAGTALN